MLGGHLANGAPREKMSMPDLLLDKDTRLTREEVTRIVGRIDDAKAVAIIESGASLQELEQAAAWAEGESDVMGEARAHASPTVIAVYEILTAEEKFPEDRESRRSAECLVPVVSCHDVGPTKTRNTLCSRTALGLLLPGRGMAQSQPEPPDRTRGDDEADQDLDSRCRWRAGAHLFK